MVGVWGISMGMAIGLIATALFLLAASPAFAASAAEIARGKYVFGATGGCGCHTEVKGPANAGGRKYEGSFGTVYSTNITPDMKTGIGGWTDEQVIKAIRLGRRLNGERIMPVHPSPLHGWTKRTDARGLSQDVPPVNGPTPKKSRCLCTRACSFPPGLCVRGDEKPPSAAPAAGGARGDYLVRDSARRRVPPRDRP